MPQVFLAGDNYFDSFRITEDKTALTALSALAQETRLKAFRLLVRAGPNGMPAGAIAVELAIPAATLSFHLKELDRSGLVSAARNGRSIVYAIRVDGIRDLLSFLTRDCCGGRAELCSIDTFDCQPLPEASS